MSHKSAPHDTKKEITYDSNGKAINPYIPKFISSAPWYSANDDANTDDYLSHQRLDPTKAVESHSEAKHGAGIVDDFPVSKKRPAEVQYDTSIYKKVRVFPKDACTNCGSLNHMRKECLEKPRKINAKQLGIVLDEEKAKLKNVSDWDSKRDRWNGYDADKEWTNQVRHWKEKEEILLEKHKAELREDNNDSELDEDEALEMAELGLAVEAKPKTEKIINLMEKEEKIPVRSREDKPIYLKNLGGEVTYNPKSRTDRSADIGYVDEHNQFVRHLNGEAEEHARLRKFAWDVNKDYNIENKDLSHLSKHLEASPTLALLEMRKKEEAAAAAKEAKRRELLAKYGEISSARPATETKSDTSFKQYTKDGTLKHPKKENYDFTDMYNPKLTKD